MKNSKKIQMKKVKSILFLISIFFISCEDKNETEKKLNSSEYVGTWDLKTFDYANSNCSGAKIESPALFETTYDLSSDGKVVIKDGFFCQDPEENEMCSATWYNDESTLTISDVFGPTKYDIVTNTLLSTDQKGTRSDGLNPTPTEFCVQVQLTKKF